MKTKFALFILCLGLLFSFNVSAQNKRTFSGTVLTQMFELVPNVTIEANTSNGKLNAQTDADGRFSLQVPDEPFSVRIYGKNIEPQTRIFSTEETIQDIQIKIKYIVPPVNENVTIQAELCPQSVFGAKHERTKRSQLKSKLQTNAM
jgi:hypothetical protein